MNILRVNRFGSEDSTDIDLMCEVDHLESTESCRKFALECEPIFRAKHSFKEELDINFCTTKLNAEGLRIVDQVYKGTADEVNNMLEATWGLHSQLDEVIVQDVVERDINLKIARALRICIAHLTRTQYRVMLKGALKDGSYQAKFDALQSVDFKFIGDLGKNNTNLIEYRKTVAFQFAQVFGLIYNREVFTKRNAEYELCDLDATKMLRRESITQSRLDIMVKYWLRKLETYQYTKFNPELAVEK